MKAYLRDKQSFIALSPVPKKDIPDGITIFLDRPNNDYSLPQMTCDIKAGIMRYDLPENIRGHVISAIVKEG